MRPPPKIPPIVTSEQVAPSLNRTIAAMNALAEWMHEFAESVASAKQPERPVSQFRDFKAAVCRQCQEEIRAEDRERLDRAVADHLRDVHHWYGAGRRDIKCPDCTDTQPCERAQRLLSGG